MDATSAQAPSSDKSKLGEAKTCNSTRACKTTLSFCFTDFRLREMLYYAATLNNQMCLTYIYFIENISFEIFDCFDIDLLLTNVGVGVGV